MIISNSKKQFLDLDRTESDIFLFQNSFDLSLEDVLVALQLELINLKANELSKEKKQRNRNIHVYASYSIPSFLFSMNFLLV